MFEKILSLIQQVIDGHFVPKARAEQAEAKLAECTERAATLEAQLAQSNDGRVSESTLLTEANQALSSVTTERDTLKSEVETLKANAKTVDEAAAIKAREICAAQGIPAATVTTASTTAVTSAEQELGMTRDALLKETDPKKRAALAAKCRELRGHSNLFSEPTKA